MPGLKGRYFCVRNCLIFFVGEYSSVWPEICRVLSKIQWRFLGGFSGKNYFGRIFKKFCANQCYHLPKLVKFRPNSWNFILGSYCAEKNHTSTFISCLHPGKESRPETNHKKKIRGRKARTFCFGKPVFFTPGLGLTTPYFLGILVWNFYQTFVTVSVEFWLRFEPRIHPTGLTINFLFITVRAERKIRLCAKLFDFFSWVNTHPFDLKFVAFCPKFSGDS